MARRLGLLGVFLAWMWLGGCFSGGEVIDQGASDGGLESDGDSVVGDTAGQDTADDKVDSGAVSDADGCGPGAMRCDGACVEVASSVEHCGGCGVMCEASGANSEPVCAGGVCGQNCTPGWSDGDGDTENGCELECETSQGGEEICDGVDNDCNGMVDDGFSTGACTVGVGACEASGEFVCADADSAECDATAGTPTDEVCSDGIDNDCDGETDEDDASDATMWFADTDGDGFGDAAVSVRACEKPQDHVDNDTDCDDTDAGVHTTVDGWADQDGDGYTSGGMQTLCTDGALPAGYVAAQNGEDCDDTSQAVNPVADEVCGDQIDNNCDNQIDDASAVDATTWYVDCDGDGYAADTAGNRVACTEPSAPSGCSASGQTWTETRPNGASSTDCNDDEADAFPGQTDYFTSSMSGSNFNEKWDFNCDGVVDFDFTRTDATCSSCAIASGDSAGWVDSFEPSCGQTESFQNCYLDFQTQACGNDIVSRTQACR